MTDKPPSMVDWEFARQTAGRFVRPGPEIPAEEIAAAVAELREGAEASEGPVREYTGLHARTASAPILVVDRPGWVTANTEGFASILSILEAKIAESGKYPKGPTRLVGAKVAGAEVGALLAFMSSKVLGQFDPFWEGSAQETGRLLLVAPNIVTVERELDVDPRDFRLWVCLHEETHRVQFTAVPWLRDHVQGLIASFVESTEVDPNGISRLMSDGAAELGRVLRGEPDSSIVDVLQNPRQREVVDQMTGVMSLLEGHADVVMDGVGPEVIPSVRKIRKRFNQRRKGKGGLDSLLRRLLGLDAKIRQYRDGATFVRAVVDKVGHDGFNAVWAEPANVPSKAEIAEPDTWLARVHG
ncbi:zinc-dependent metalloprotease [Nocardioidaceae bacterium SCSIO 66511]|nr:zinc-dependent metalloprotease [Nocardioidaceae bacterium SCSIO 66511]